MNENELMFIPLKISFIRKNFIENYSSNYEEYLTEYINNSKFIIDHGNQLFELNEVQSNKESDITNKEYEIEYKLLIDSKTMENLIYYSENICIDKNGARFFSASKLRGEWRRYFLTNIIKDISLKRLKELENKKQVLNEFERIVANYLNKIQVNKNALYFLQYIFFYNKKNNNEKIYDALSNKFSKDLKSFMEYRKAYTKRDTFLCFLTKKKIVFLKYKNRFVFYDAVDIEKSNKFMELWRINDIWDSLFWN